MRQQTNIDVFELLDPWKSTIGKWKEYSFVYVRTENHWRFTIWQYHRCVFQANCKNDTKITDPKWDDIKPVMKAIKQHKITRIGMLECTWRITLGGWLKEREEQ